MGVKLIMFLKAPGSIKSPSLIKQSVLKKITINQFDWLFLSEWYKIRLTALYVLKLSELTGTCYIEEQACFKKAGSTAGLIQPNFFPYNCIQQPSNCGSTQISLKTPQILTDSLLLFCVSASACLIQHLALTQVSRGCQITHSSTKVLKRHCFNRFHNAHNSLRTRHSVNATCTEMCPRGKFSSNRSPLQQAELSGQVQYGPSIITQLLTQKWQIYKQKYL